MGNYVLRCFMWDLVIFKLHFLLCWNRQPDGGKSETHASQSERHQVDGSCITVFGDDLVLVKLYLS